MGIIPFSRGLRACAVRLLCVVALPVMMPMPASRAGGSAASWNAAKLEKARALIRDVVEPRYVRKGSIPRAISVAVSVNGRIVFAEGRGDARPGVPAGPHTVYRIGSITKQFLAVAMLNAIAERKIRSQAGQEATLESRLSEILSEASAWDEEGGRPLTLRSLLTMTSNLVNFTRKPPPELDPWVSVSTQDLRTALAKMRHQAVDGGFSYSNTGYFLLSEVLREARPDRSYEEAMRQFAIHKAGLAETGFADEEEFSTALAEPAYGRRPAFIKPSWLQGSADMVSSVLDLCKWNNALMSGTLLSPRDFAAMLGDEARVDVWTYYGMGWFITHKDAIDTFFHSGTVPGFTGFNAIYKHSESSWLSVSILSNKDGVEELPQLSDALAELAYAEN